MVGMALLLSAEAMVRGYFEDVLRVITVAPTYELILDPLIPKPQYF